MFPEQSGLRLIAFDLIAFFYDLWLSKRRVGIRVPAVQVHIRYNFLCMSGPYSNARLHCLPFVSPKLEYSNWCAFTFYSNSGIVLSTESVS
jgi:hypothetical protein